MNPKDLAIFIGKYVRQNRAKDITIIDISKVSSLADYFVICTGLTNRHNQAMIQDLKDILSKQKIRPQGSEGLETGRWAILDYDDVVLHIFSEEGRKFYELDDIWSDGKQVQLPPESPDEQPISPAIHAILTNLEPAPIVEQSSIQEESTESEKNALNQVVEQSPIQEESTESEKKSSNQEQDDITNTPE